MRDGQQFESYKVSHTGHLRPIALQLLRPAAREEQISEHDAMRRLNKIVDKLAGLDGTPTGRSGLETTIPLAL